MSIVVKDVSKFYGDQKALNNVSFEVQTGEIVGFLGPNGAGKSTMMKIITGFLSKSSGSVSVCGIDIEEDSLNARSKIGYLPEHNPLYLDMYVKEYLEFVAGIYKLDKDKVNKGVKDMIELTGLGVEQNKKIGALSKGYRQRVGLAQALIHNPKVLILDEPTTGLDPNQLVEIRNLIKNIGQDKTVMLSTHIMQEVKAICKKVIIVNRGEIVANDGVTNLTAESNEVNVQVEFDGKITTADIKTIKLINKIEQVAPKIWIVSGKDEKQLKVELFNLAVSKNAIVVGLKSIENTLEDVFHKVTKE